MEEIFQSRPFKTRNADEFDLGSILSLFVSPIDGLTSPFDYENTIVKGRMGSGKTMYLRANYAYYLYRLVPTLINDESEKILPVLIKLSDFQHIKEPSEVYRSIIIKIIEELASIYLHLQDAHRLAQLHNGIISISEKFSLNSKFTSTMAQLAKLGSEEYIERVSNTLGIDGSIKPKLFSLSAKWQETKHSELKNKSNPGIKDVEECYKNLLEEQNGKILLLIDEAGALDKSFFAGKETSSFFEILMNQFRTSAFIRTKIAIYPNSYSDMLTETRYGDVVSLEQTVTDERGFSKFRKCVCNILSNYINEYSNSAKTINSEEIFEISGEEFGDSLEQIIFASNGNMRRLIQLLDLAMNITYRECNGAAKVTKDMVLETLKENAASVESIFTDDEREFIGGIVATCKSRGAYKFKFPNMSPVLYKYTEKSQEYNIVNIEEVGTGRKGTIYYFDYSYTVLKDIPTHYISNSEKINRDRSLLNGTWIGRVTQMSPELLEQANMPGKIEGEIDYLQKDAGFIKGSDGEQYYFNKNYIIKDDRNKYICVGKNVRFYPSSLADSKIASNLEIL
ncbi:MAG TPA: hypothetical protein ENH23_04055 [candidate division Zixibacteria bacterium]|nr:hypothetical protein [candidate division Zixibacteria bacterium]